MLIISVVLLIVSISLNVSALISEIFPSAEPAKILHAESNFNTVILSPHLFKLLPFAFG